MVTQGHGSSIMLMEMPQKARQIEGGIRLPTEVGSTWDNRFFFPEAASSSLANRANASLQDNKNRARCQQKFPWHGFLVSITPFNEPLTPPESSTRLREATPCTGPARNIVLGRERKIKRCDHHFLFVSLGTSIPSLI